MAHKDSGFRCLVCHWENGKLAPSCIRCERCRQWIRPEAMNDVCDPASPPALKPVADRLERI